MSFSVLALVALIPYFVSIVRKERQRARERERERERENYV